jgi:multiple sugar transport system substrate-binding protein
MRKMLSAVLLGAALLATGCGGGGDDDSSSKSASGGVVRITLWHGQNQSAQKTIESLVDAFNRTHKNIKVDAETGAPADNLYSKITAALAGGSYPDVSFQFGPNVASLARSPKAVDLTDAVKGDGWNWDDFFPAAREAVTIDGRVRAVPAVIDSLAVLYNRKLFKQAGLEEPKPGWTWDDFRADAKAMTDESKGRFGTGWPGVGDEDTVWRIWPLVWQAGGDVLSSDGKTAGFAGESGQRAFDTVAGLAADKSVYVDKTVGSEQMYRVFLAGRMGMVPTGPWELPEVLNSKVDYGVAPMPALEGEPTTISGPDTYMVFDNGDARARAAEEFVKWLSQPAQEARWDTESGSLPLRRSTADQDVWKAHVEKVAGLDAFVTALGEARVRPVIKQYPKLSESVGRSLAGVLLGQKDAQSALDEAVKGTNEALAGD